MLARLTISSRRAFASLHQPSAEIEPALKARLRDLYKRVHPDLFQYIPAAKEANERSFKLLQEYLAAAKDGGGVGRTAGVAYRFNFYIRQATPDSDADNLDDGDAAAAMSTLTNVALTLPPPTRGVPGEALSSSTRKAFSRLLEACGVPNSFDVGARDAAATPRSLRAFVPRAAEAVHQAAAARGGPRFEAHAVRTALQLTRGVAVTVAGRLAGAGAAEATAQLLQLADVLEGLASLDVSGLAVGLDDEFNTDSRGTLWLRAGATPQAWAEYLSAARVDYCRGRRALVARVQAQQRALSSALGVGVVVTAMAQELEPPFMQFLERMAAGAAAGRGEAPAGGALSQLGIFVEAADGGAGGAAAACSVSDTGLLNVPAGASFEELRRALAALGPRAAGVARRRREGEEELSRLRTQVERKLRVRRLSREAGLPADRFRAACLRLLQHAAEVGPLLEGLPVRVGEANGLPADRSTVDIAWNWIL